MVVAVIADIVGSRRLPDRAAAQQDFDRVIARVQRDHPLADQPLSPTVGDEQQGVYPGLAEALHSLLMVQLALPDGREFRFGLGVGDIGPVAAATRELTDGPGWWAARTAIEIVHERQRRSVPSARTWVVAADDQDEVDPGAVAVANAYLLARDDLVARMSARERRLAYGRACGLTQDDLARREQITQPSVSKALRGSGAAALLEGLTVLTGGDR